MDFKAILQLKLKDAFCGEQKLQNIVDDKDLLNELFECDNRGNLFVYDDGEVGHSVYIQDTKGIGRDKIFIVQNQDHKDVFLWHIDGVLYKKNSKCDCALLTDMDMNFVEFKSNAENNSNAAMQDNYQKASDQILLTLKDISCKCNSVGVVLTNVVKVKAFAVFNRSVPRNDALRKKISAKFLKDSDGVKLVFDNTTSMR